MTNAPAYLDGIVLDESSILKSIDGKTRKMLLEHFTSIDWRLCCTATPCPNDIAELANHAEFLGIMRRTDMLASFFVHDEDGWRMRGHAREAFFRWLASWAMAMKSPEDLGYDGSRFRLPELKIIDEVVDTDWRRPESLFPGGLKGITDRSSVRRESVADRVERAAEIANATDEQIIVWCGLNDESTAVTAKIPDSVEVKGADSFEQKVDAIRGFIEGRHRVLVTKPKIAGFGMNFQNANRMIFLGLSDSYEAYYQCIRRAWRYGQTQPVNVHVVVTDHETEIVENVRRKEWEAERLSAEIVASARRYEMEELGKLASETEEITRDEFEGERWKVYQGDCIEEMQQIEDESVDLSIFSPPFLALYQYSNTERDLGNSSSDDEFFDHFKYVIEGLMRVTKPGRNCCVHVAQVATTLNAHGVIGLKDFRGRVIAEFVKQGWIYHGEVCIDKCPQAQAIRTHSKGLLFVQMRKDSSWSRPGLADYILIFRKPGENAVPIHPDITNDQWIEWARPIWYNIRESDTLNTTEAKADEDDRHVCPLQLETIERCIRLWSNEGEVVFSPFAGIGSELHEAVRLGRYGLGIELKPLYARTAVKNCKRAEQRASQPTLFSGVVND
jgi:DNA modification methylase